MAVDERYPADPFGNYWFALEINGQQIAEFMEASGLKSSAAIYEIEEGGYNGHVHKRPGYSKWDNIILKNATNASTGLLEWRDKYLQEMFTDGSRMTDSGSIVMYSNEGKELRRFNFIHAWPVAWEGPGLNAGGSELAIETLEIAHDGIFINGKPPPEPEKKEDPPVRLPLKPVQFEFDDDTITPEGKKTVAEAAKLIAEYEITELWIEGHSCYMGSLGYNKSLSDARAASVVKELKAQGANSTVYHSAGFGWLYPVASNFSQGGCEANRRTEFMTTSYQDRGLDPLLNAPESAKYGDHPPFPWQP